MTDKVQKIREEVGRRIVFQKECIKNSYRLTGKPEEEIILEYKQLLSFIDSLSKEPVSEDLEEAADNALDKVWNTHEIINVRSCLEMFRYGAQWQKEQMTKEAVEATVYNKAYPTEFEIETNTFMQKLKHGDKVKVIIIKED